MSDAGWIPVCAASDVGEDAALSVRVRGVRVLIARSQGRLYALHDECPHQSRSLVDGRVAHGAVTCRYHSVQVALDNGAVLHDNGYIGLPPVPVFPVRVADGRVFIRLDGGTPGAAP